MAAVRYPRAELAARFINKNVITNSYYTNFLTNEKLTTTFKAPNKSGRIIFEPELQELISFCDFIHDFNKTGLVSVLDFYKSLLLKPTRLILDTIINESNIQEGSFNHPYIANRPNNINPLNQRSRNVFNYNRMNTSVLDSNLYKYDNIERILINTFVDAQYVHYSIIDKEIDFMKKSKKFMMINDNLDIDGEISNVKSFGQYIDSGDCKEQKGCNPRNINNFKAKCINKNVRLLDINIHNFEYNNSSFKSKSVSNRYRYNGTNNIYLKCLNTNLYNEIFLENFSDIKDKKIFNINNIETNINSDIIFNIPNNIIQIDDNTNGIDHNIKILNIIDFYPCNYIRPAIIEPLIGDNGNFKKKKGPIYSRFVLYPTLITLFLYYKNNIIQQLSDIKRDNPRSETIINPYINTLIRETFSKELLSNIIIQINTVGTHLITQQSVTNIYNNATFRNKIVNIARAKLSSIPLSIKQSEGINKIQKDIKDKLNLTNSPDINQISNFFADQIVAQINKNIINIQNNFGTFLNEMNTNPLPGTPVNINLISKNDNIQAPNSNLSRSNMYRNSIIGTYTALENLSNNPILQPLNLATDENNIQDLLRNQHNIMVNILQRFFYLTDMNIDFYNNTLEPGEFINYNSNGDRVATGTGNSMDFSKINSYSLYSNIIKNINEEYNINERIQEIFYNMRVNAFENTTNFIFNNVLKKNILYHTIIEKAIMCSILIITKIKSLGDYVMIREAALNRELIFATGDKLAAFQCALNGGRYILSSQSNYVIFKKKNDKNIQDKIKDIMANILKNNENINRKKKSIKIFINLLLRNYKNIDSVIKDIPQLYKSIYLTYSSKLSNKHVVNAKSSNNIISSVIGKSSSHIQKLCGEANLAKCVKQLYSNLKSTKSRRNEINHVQKIFENNIEDRKTSDYVQPLSRTLSSQSGLQRRRDLASHGLAPLASHGLASSASHGLAPSVSHSLAHSAGHGLVPSTSHGLAPSASHGLVPSASNGRKQKRNVHTANINSITLDTSLENKIFTNIRSNKIKKSTRRSNSMSSMVENENELGLQPVSLLVPPVPPTSRHRRVNNSTVHSLMRSASQLEPFNKGELFEDNAEPQTLHNHNHKPHLKKQKSARGNL